MHALALGLQIYLRILFLHQQLRIIMNSLQINVIHDLVHEFSS